MPTFRYGSVPVSPYGLDDFVRHLAPHLPKDDKVFFCNGSLAWRKNVSAVSMDFFRSLCYWKSPRMHATVANNRLSEVHRRFSAAVHAVTTGGYSDPIVQSALRELCALRGVGVPTASALLTAWNPDEFGIMDFKVCKLLGIVGDTNAFATYPKLLDSLRDRKRALGLACALRQIELAVWHYYPVQLSDRKTF